MFLCCKCFENIAGVVFFSVLLTEPTWQKAGTQQMCVKSMETLGCKFIENNFPSENHESIAMFKQQRKVDHAVLEEPYSESCERHVAHPS